MMDTITPSATDAKKMAWLKERECDVEKYVPPHMQHAICDYLIFGAPVGSFLSALLANDLMVAILRADDINTASLRNWALFLYNETPSECYGSPILVKAWRERGGLARFVTPDAA